MEVEKSPLENLQEEVNSNSLMKSIDDALCGSLESMLRSINLPILSITQNIIADQEKEGAVFIPGSATPISSFEEIEETGEAFELEIHSWCAEFLKRNIALTERYMLVKEIAIAIQNQMVYNKALNIDRRAEHPEIVIPEETIVS